MELVSPLSLFVDVVGGLSLLEEVVGGLSLLEEVVGGLSLLEEVVGGLSLLEEVVGAPSLHVDGIGSVCVILLATDCLLNHLPTSSGSSASFMNGSASSMALSKNSVFINIRSWNILSSLQTTKSQYSTSHIFNCNCI